LVRASSDVTRDVIRDVSDAPPTSATSVSCQLTAQTATSAIQQFRILWI